MTSIVRSAAKLLAALSLLGLIALDHAQAQYPERGLTLIVPYGAGGGTDVTARLLAKDLEGVLGKPVTVQNIAGGGGWLGWGTLAAAGRDGYTLGYLNVPSMYAGYLDAKIGRKETLDSFTPLMNHVIDYNVWAVKADSPFKTVKDVIEAARKAPDTISVTAYGAGSDDHLRTRSRRSTFAVSLPGPQRTRSPPPPAARILSRPPPPETRSRPRPASRRSSPAPPPRRSPPPWPAMQSLPLRPLTRSRPPPPLIASGPSEPSNSSGPGPPRWGLEQSGASRGRPARRRGAATGRWLTSMKPLERWMS